MKDTLKVSSGAFLLLALVSSFVWAGTANQSPPGDGQTFDRTFLQRFSALAIENPTGRTEVQTWNSNRVRVMASRRTGGGNANSINSRMRFQMTPEALRIVVRPGALDDAINLFVYVPRQIVLNVKGATETVVVSGATSALSVETETGSISLHLPLTANTDLSLRAIEGTITSKLQMMIFGPVNAHSLDGRIGLGGAPVILRSAHGSIDLLPDDAARLANADAQMANDRNAVAEQRIIKSSTVLNPNGNSVGTANGSEGSISEKTGTGGGSGLSDATGPSINRADPPVVDVIKIDSRLVNLNVKVTDASGKLIPDLNKDDFQIFEDSVEQEVAQFEPVTSPVNVVLLLDLSGSTQDRWKVIKKAAKKFIDTLSPNTHIAVAAFARRFVLISDFTDDRKLLKNRIDDMKKFNSGTAFYDSTWSTLDLFNEVKERRKAIVVMTDGVDNSLSSFEYEPRHPFDELLARMIQEEVTIYPIYFDTEYEVTVKMRGQDTHESYVTARQQLQKIADETGGTLFRADRAEDLEGVYQRVASELQTLYTVAYNPRDKNYDGKWRSVSVKVKRPQAGARTKTGFYAK
jgi:VWFA-related protein